ncbi:hypothetical protein FO521_17050 [Bacillus pseudomycoides]|nr:hypothetical protein [Bacillus pseudomycoides]
MKFAESLRKKKEHKKKELVPSGGTSSFFLIRFVNGCRILQKRRYMDAASRLPLLLYPATAARMLGGFASSYEAKMPLRQKLHPLPF